jgi:hypothetical protein
MNPNTRSVPSMLFNRMTPDCGALTICNAAAGRRLPTFVSCAGARASMVPSRSVSDSTVPARKREPVWRTCWRCCASHPRSRPVTDHGEECEHRQILLDADKALVAGGGQVPTKHAEFGRRAQQDARTVSDARDIAVQQFGLLLRQIVKLRPPFRPVAELDPDHQRHDGHQTRQDDQKQPGRQSHALVSCPHAESPPCGSETRKHGAH